MYREPAWETTTSRVAVRGEPRCRFGAAVLQSRAVDCNRPAKRVLDAAPHTVFHPFSIRARAAVFSIAKTLQVARGCN